MKNLQLLAICILTSLTAFCQIPNASFEEWEQIDNYDKPVGWETNQDTFTARIIQDSVFKVDGEYSMHFVSNASSAWQSCTSRIYSWNTLNDELEENQSLYFYLKMLSINSNDDAYFEVQMTGYKNNEVIGTAHSIFFEEYEEFELIELPMNFAGADLIIFNFLGGALDGPADGCIFRSTSWLDGLEIKESSLTSIITIENVTIDIYPNPSFGKIEIKGDWEKYDSFKIYDLYGRELENGLLQSSELTLISKGILFLILKSNTGNQSVFKIINR